MAMVMENGIFTTLDPVLLSIIFQKMTTRKKCASITQIMNPNGGMKI